MLAISRRLSRLPSTLRGFGEQTVERNLKNASLISHFRSASVKLSHFPNSGTSFSSPHHTRSFHQSTTTTMPGSPTLSNLTLDIEKLSSWSKENGSDLSSALASTVISNHGAATALISREAIQNKKLINVFSNVVTPEGSPIMNQKQSGRCWLFAGTNQMRIGIMRKYNLSELELSPSYLFFYDKLEKANFFLNQIEETAYKFVESKDETEKKEYDVESRLIQHLLTDPVVDGGQYDMFANIIAKYGLVPNHIYPDSFNTLASRNMNYMITTLLRQYAQEIRELVISKNGSEGLVDELKKLREDQIKHIYKLLCTFLGTPPGPNDPIVWEYVDKDKKYGSVETTPLGFYKDVVEYDVQSTISLLNDPRNEYNRLIKVDRLGNVVGRPYVTYVNVDIDVVSKTAVEMIKANTPVFFGTHTPIYHDRKSGLIDTDLWDYKLIGFDPKQNKADRLRYHQSLMTHAMLFTGVHLDPKTGEPVRWKVENSWGSDPGIKGYFIMSHDFFKEYVYQIVVQKQDVKDEKLQKLIENWDNEEAIVLPPWDPCGALAKI